jgi:hypothetical protein
MGATGLSVTRAIIGYMADSGSLRVRRHRLHSRGDHSLCKRCEARAIPVGRPPSGPGGDAATGPRASLQALAARLEAAHEADPADAAVARELRATLLALGAGEGTEDDADAFMREFRSA